MYGRKWQPNSLAWRIPWTKEPGRLQSMGSQRVGHNLATEHAHTLVGLRPCSKDLEPKGTHREKI